MNEYILIMTIILQTSVGPTASVSAVPVANNSVCHAAGTRWKISAASGIRNVDASYICVGNKR